MTIDTVAADHASGPRPRKEPPHRSDLVLDAQGRWLSDGVVVTHRGILDALHGGVRREPSGEFSVQIGWQKGLVTVEGAPYFVRSVAFPEGAAPRVTLLDATEHDLDPATLTLAAEDDLFCLVRGERARFLPAAMHQIGERLVEKGDDLYLSLGGFEYPIRRGGEQTPADA